MEQKKFKLIKNEGNNYGYIVDENDVYIQVHAYAIQYIENLQEQLNQTKLELQKEKENHEIDLQNWSNDLKELEPMYNENEKMKNEIEGLDIEVEFLKEENKELEEENEQLKALNAKLRCLALRFIFNRLLNKYLHGFCVNRDRVKRHAYYYFDAYNKAKKKLMEGK